LQYDVQVGGGVPGLGNINAEVDEFALYDHALSWPQIAKHYNVAVSYYASIVLGDSPVAYWQLADTGSTALDATANGATGTYDSSVTHTSSGADFDGSGGITGSGLTVNGAADTYTVEAWVDPASNNTFTGYVFAKGANWTTVGFGLALSEYSPYGQEVVLLSANATYLTGYVVPSGRVQVACVFSPSAVGRRPSGTRDRHHVCGIGA
jgi:hypothetical protein